MGSYVKVNDFNAALFGDVKRDREAIGEREKEREKKKGGGGQHRKSRKAKD
jgi:hypothetical protein